MKRRRTSDRTIFFPWERSSGLLLGRRIARAKWILTALAALIVYLLLRSHERGIADERATRATLGVVHGALEAYRAEHDGGCPPSLDTLRSDGFLAAPINDAWGNPLRLVCPGRRDPLGYDLMSNGPDGEPGGLDRVE